MSEKSRLIDTLLCVFLGWLGIHRFYEGKIASGIIYVLSFGLLFVGWLTDLILILFGWSVDAHGKAIKDWRRKNGKS